MSFIDDLPENFVVAKMLSWLVHIDAGVASLDRHVLEAREVVLRGRRSGVRESRRAERPFTRVS